MIQNFFKTTPWRLAAITTCTLLALSSASAQTASAKAKIKASDSYQQETQACNNGQTNQDKETCLKEARNAEAERKRGALTKPDANYKANTTTRCAVLSGEYKVACLARMTGYGKTTGSVNAGGVLRQSETVVVPTGPGSVTITPKTDGPIVVIPASN